MADDPPIYDPFLTRAPAAERASQAPPAEPAAASGMAIWSLVLGILSFTCLPAVGGLLALTLGIAAKGEITRAEGRKSGAGLAIGGAVLGGLNLVLSLAGFAALMLWGATTSPGPTTPPSPPVVVAPPSPTFAPMPAPTAAKPPRGRSSAASSRDDGVTLTRVGRVDLVDVGSNVSSLTDELDRQRTLAKKDGKNLLLWVVVKDCQPCNGVAASLTDPSMQSALERIRLVRVDAGELGPELAFLGIPVAKVPGFALLSDANRPVDYVNGGEWDEDVAKNIAPVLGKFVEHRYSKRREQWRGVRRDDETTL